MKNNTLLMALIVLFGFAAHCAQAANSTWNGATANWGTGGNWNGGLSSSSQSALFNSAFASQPNLSGTASTAQGLWLATGAGQAVTIDSTPTGAMLTITGNATLGTANQANAGILLDDSANDSLTLTSNVGVTLGNNTGFYVNIAASLTLNGTLNLNGNTLTLGGSNAGGSTVINGGISASAGAITVNTSGAVILAGSNSHTGATTLTSGTLILKNQYALQNSALTVNVNNGLGFASGIGTFNVGSLSGTANIVLSDTTSGAVTLSSGGNNGSTTYSGTISGNGSLTKVGSGQLTLSGANTYSGGTTIGGGTIYIGLSSVVSGGVVTSGATGVGNISFGIGSTVAVTNQFGANLSAPKITLGGAGGTLNLTSGNRMVITANTWDLGDASRTGVTRINVNGKSLAVTGGNTLSSGEGSGVNQWEISTAPNGGNTVIQNGTLDLETTSFTGANYGAFSFRTFYNWTNASLIIGRNVLVQMTSNGSLSGVPLSINSGGILDIAHFANTVASLSDGANGGRSIFNSMYVSNATAQTLTINGTSGSTTFSGLISDGPGTGALSLVKSGNNTQILSGSNAYSGGTTVSGGTLVFPSGAFLSASGGCTVASAGALVMNTSFAGSVTVASGGALSGTGSVASVTTSGVVAAGNGGSTDVLTAGSITFGNGATLSVSLGGTTSSSIVASGTVTIGSSPTDLIPLKVNLNTAPVDGAVYTILTPGSLRTVGSLSSSGTALANGAQFLVSNGTNAELFSIAYGSTSVTLTALHAVVLPQTIQFGSLAWKAVGTADFNPGAVASSGLPVSYTSSNPAVASIVNNQIHLIASGTVTITANQAGNGLYLAATPVTQTLVVYPSGLGSQTINFPGFYQKTLSDADFSLAAAASSGLPVTYTSLDTSVATIVNGMVHVVGPGIAMIEADQGGNSSFYPSAPVVKYFTVVNDNSVTWARTPENEVFQYSFTATQAWVSGSSTTYSTSTAYLWIPENCSKLRGLIVMQTNVPEHMLVGHPAIRKAAYDNSLGIVFCLPGFYNATAGQEATNVVFIQTLLNGLATASGYAEVATVPWLPMGESGALTMVAGLVSNAPDRCIAAIYMKNARLSATGYNVPVLQSIGSAYEWGQTGGDIRTGWLSTNEYDSCCIWRNYTNSGTWPASVLWEPGTGHFWVSEPMVQYYAKYIGKVCNLRLSSDGSAALRSIDVTTGYLADLPVPGHSSTPVTPFASGTYNRPWFPDVDSAQQAQAMATADFTAQTQLPDIYNGVNCTINPFSFNGINQISVVTTSTFGVSETLDAVIPPQFAVGGGAPLAQSAGTPNFDWICGSFVPTGNGGFRVIQDRAYNTTASYFMVTKDAAPGIRECVQPVGVSISKNTAGSAQTITFNSIPDVPAGTSSIQLSATSNAGLPVSFSVLSGPAVIKNNILVFTKIPPNSTFPVQVVVQASQWGSATAPQVQTAPLVSQTFNLLRSTQTISMPAIPAFTFGAGDYSPGGVASSVLPVTYTSDNPGVITITADGKLHIVGAGTANITASQSGDVNYTAATAVTQQVTVYTGLQSWRIANFGTPLASGSTADTADPTGGGIPNLIRYALGLGIASPANGVLPTAGILNGYLTLSYTPTASDVTYTVEGTSDLMNWSPIAVNPGTVGSEAIVSDTTPISSATRRFLRLRVTNP